MVHVKVFCLLMDLEVWAVIPGLDNLGINQGFNTRSTINFQLNISYVHNLFIIKVYNNFVTNLITT
jgi:hypothetical protein